MAMSARANTEELPAKKLRFRSTTNIHYHNENKVEDIFRTTDLRDYSRGTQDFEEVNKKKG
jgi:hypothetical protein